MALLHDRGAFSCVTILVHHVRLRPSMPGLGLVVAFAVELLCPTSVIHHMSAPTPLSPWSTIASVCTLRYSRRPSQTMFQKPLMNVRALHLHPARTWPPCCQRSCTTRACSRVARGDTRSDFSDALPYDGFGACLAVGYQTSIPGDGPFDLFHSGALLHRCAPPPPARRTTVEKRYH
ncbi:hypothetical protein BV25DRAFT_260282 [Artomyces pyxidatus]|uniref:Uncharacterized protein n=1 Tax=Artomyces pyxidatus TaxID=48021 RepID=A0ACB8T736_9AGAM|nr:hypothetical protein BV25DRAFT_260282 [Artomyces pyxidatus]